MNVPDENRRAALMLAAFSGHSQIVQYLIECGPDINTCEEEEKTALSKAAQKGHLDIAKLLVESGASSKQLLTLEHTHLGFFWLG